MKISLIFPPAKFLMSQMVNPPLGLAYLSGYLKANNYKDIKIHHIIDDNIPEINADIIGIGFTTPQFNGAMEILNKLKILNPNALFIAGGVHATAKPEDCLKAGFDVVVRGEGEKALLDIVRRYENNEKIERIVDGEEIHNLDDIPFPDYEEIGITKYKWVSGDGVLFASMMTSRGCPSRCRYCASSAMWNKVRLNSVEYVKRHIDYLHEVFGIQAIAFQDDVFPINKKRLKEVAEYLKSKNMKFRCLARANNLDKETVKIFKDNGCTEVCFGLESGNQQMLDMMDKKMTVDINRQAVLNCKEAGLSVKTFIILGIPGESKESIEDTITLLEEVQPDDIDANVLILYPATEFYDNMDKYDIVQEITDLDNQYLKGKIADYVPTVRTSKITSAELEHYRKLIFNRFSKLAREKKK